MPNFEICSFSKPSQRFLTEGEDEYIKRLRPYAQVKLSVLKTKAVGAAPDLLKKAEAELLLEQIKGVDQFIVLDEGGQQCSSSDLANLLEGLFIDGKSRILFAIGGPFGWAPSILQQADRVISLSRLTFTSQFARLLLIEQLYRAITIMRGLPYHK